MDRHFNSRTWPNLDSSEKFHRRILSFTIVEKKVFVGGFIDKNRLQCCLNPFSVTFTGDSRHTT